MARTQIQKSIQGRSLGFSVTGALVLNLLDNSQIVVDPTGLIYTNTAGTTTLISGGGTWGIIAGSLSNQTDLVNALALKGDKSGKLNQFAATSSAELLGVMSDETGSGSLVFGTSPALATPALTSPTLAGNTVGNTVAPGGTTVALSATSLTLSAALHNGNLIAANNASPIAITVNTGLGAGFSCAIVQTGAGIVTVSGSATLNGTPALSTAGIGSSLTLLWTATDTYTVLSPVNGLTINNQTGTTYTLVASDAGARVDMSNAGSNTLTIPSNASVPFPIGTVVNVRQGGAGATTIAINTDTLIKPTARSFTISAQYEQAVLTKTAATTWECIAS